MRNQNKGRRRELKFAIFAICLACFGSKSPPKKSRRLPFPLPAAMMRAPVVRAVLQNAVEEERWTKALALSGS